mmetsp:Transcript_86427/g.241815  ORF Transcript_86427/g.241815 Transcript_86427/m.241815 type:complete len:113 (+) Transcript_86427:936-1274(+)
MAGGVGAMCAIGTFGAVGAKGVLGAMDGLGTVDALGTVAALGVAEAWGAAGASDAEYAEGDAVATSTAAFEKPAELLSFGAEAAPSVHLGEELRLVAIVEYERPEGMVWRSE